jgi:hypothetical protein
VSVCLCICVCVCVCVCVCACVDANMSLVIAMTSNSHVDLPSTPQVFEFPALEADEDGCDEDAGDKVEQGGLSRLHVVQHHERDDQPHRIGCNTTHGNTGYHSNTGHTGTQDTLISHIRHN